jgi:hypothetical protein
MFSFRGTDGLITPHGGSLVDAMVTDEAQKKQLISECEGRKMECSHRNACDVELLCVGGFSPLDGFMNQVCPTRGTNLGAITQWNAHDLELRKAYFAISSVHFGRMNLEAGRELHTITIARRRNEGQPLDVQRITAT